MITKKKIIFLIIGGLFTAFLIFIIIQGNKADKKQKEQNKIIAEPTTQILTEYFKTENGERLSISNDNKPYHTQAGKYWMKDGETTYWGTPMIEKSYTFYGFNLDQTKVQYSENLPNKLPTYTKDSFKSWQEQNTHNSAINNNLTIYGYFYDDVFNNEPIKLTKTSKINNFLTLKYEGPKDIIETDKEYMIGFFMSCQPATLFFFGENKYIFFDVYFNPVKNYLTLYQQKEQLQTETKDKAKKVETEKNK